MKSARILIVDDERPNIEILLRCLKQRGHTGVGAENAEDAANRLSEGTFDLVLLDHVLPGVTGMQALPRLKSLTSAPIYIMSGYSDDETRRDAELLGAAGFFAKPLDLDTLFATLAALPGRGE